MAYKVIESFLDVQENIVYYVGDVFPAEGKKASKKRVSELAGKDNAVGRPLIVAEEKPKNPKD